MKNIELHAKQLNAGNRRKTKWHRIITIMSAIVVFFTTYALILPAITWERQLVCEREEHTHSSSCYETVLVSESERYVCGMEEHTHGDGCWSENRVLVCGLEESAEHTHTDDCYITEKTLICPLAEHTHTDDCIIRVEAHEEQVLTCTKQEHAHADSCFDAPPSEDAGYYCGQVAHKHNEYCYYADGTLRCTITEHEHTLSCEVNRNADLETAADWEKTISELSLVGNWHHDVMTVAESQLGYRESYINFELEGESRKGYTRYGAWYGVPYGDWCAMFCSFCLHYAGVDTDLMPLNSVCDSWITALRSLNRFYSTAENIENPENAYVPQAGDLVFFDWDAYDTDHPENRVADHVGFVYEVVPATEEHSAMLRTLEGNYGDSVQYVSYFLNNSSIMGYGQLPETVSVKADVQDSVVNLTAGCNVSGEYSWQWQLSEDGENWSDISGANSLAYSFASDASSTSLRYRLTGAVQPSEGYTPSAKSPAVVVSDSFSIDSYHSSHASAVLLSEHALTDEANVSSGEVTLLEGGTGVMSDWQELESAEELDCGEEFDLVATSLSEELAFTAYDIVPEEGAVVPEEGVKVYLPAPEPMKVFGVENDELVWHDDAEFVTLEGETFMCFTAYHFSTYGVAGDASAFTFPERSSQQIVLPSSTRWETATTLTEGKTVVIQNNLNTRFINETVAYDRLTLTADFNSATRWTLVLDGSSYKLKDSNNKYLTLRSSQAGLTDNIANAAVVTIGSDGIALVYQNVNGTVYYLNDYRNEGQYAIGWNDNNAGSKSTVYQETEYTPDCWVKCASPSDISVGDTIMIESSGYVLGISGTSKTAVSASFTPVSGSQYYTVSSSAESTAYRFTVTAGSNDGQVKILCVNDSNYGIGIHADSVINNKPNGTLIIEGSSGALKISRTKDGVTHWLSCSNGAFVRTTADSGNILTIYKKVSDPAPATLDQLAVQKVVTAFNTLVTEQTEFSFKLSKASGANPSDASPVTGVSYTVYNADNTEASTGTLSDGSFKLLGGQTALFNISDSDTASYFVSECVPAVGNNLKAPTASVNGATVTVSELEGADSVEYRVPAAFNDENRSLVKFINTPKSDTPYLELSFKNIGTGDGAVTNESDFTFTVKGTDGAAAAYTSYRFVDENGEIIGAARDYNADSPAITLRDSQKVQLLGLAAGTYTVEDSLGAYDTSVKKVTAEVDDEAITVTRENAVASMQLSYAGAQSSLAVKHCLESGYTVKFDFRDGTVVTYKTNDEGVLVNDDGDSIGFPEHSRYGLELNYWSTVRDNEATKVTQSAQNVFTADTILYANWKSTQSALVSKAEASLTKTLRENTAYIDAGNYENMFDIDLSATIPHMVESISLVFDLSSSMYNQCMTCGVQHSADYPNTAHTYTGITGYDGTKHDITCCDHFVKRLDVTKQKASDFVSKLRQNCVTANKHCYVSIVGFNSGAFTVISDQDLLSDAGYSAVYDVVKPESMVLDNLAVKNTALGPGMYLGFKELSQLNETHDIDYENSCVILLSDGNPTTVDPNTVPEYTNPSSSFYVGPEAAANCTSSSYISKWQNIWSKYDHYEWMDASAFTISSGYSYPKFSIYQIMAPPYIAEQIVASGSHLYSVMVGKNVDQYAKQTGLSVGYVPGTGISNINYLDSFSESAVNVNTAESLEEFYSQMINVLSTEANEVAVTDPMSDNVVFAGFTAATGENNITVSSDGNKIYSGTTLLASFNETTKTITWNPTKNGTLSYKIRLKNEADGFNDWDETSAEYLTNRETTITYTPLRNGASLPQVTKNADVPFVHGWLGELQFTKVGGFTESGAEPLEGVTFTLHHNPDSCAVCSHLDGDIIASIADFTATSDTNGIVRFTDVPSGHSYVLSENRNYLYNPANDYTVTIAYGETAVASIGDDSGYWTLTDGQYKLFNLRTDNAELPETGGEGTVRLYVIGILLTASAALMYTSGAKRKRGSRSG